MGRRTNDLHCRSCRSTGLDHTHLRGCIAGPCAVCRPATRRSRFGL